MTRLRTSDAIEQSLFYPTGGAYLLIVVGYLRVGLAVYLTFLIVACLVGWLKRITEWPLFTKIILASGPPLLGLGYFFSMQRFTLGMLLPGIIYYILGIVGTAALKGLDNT